MVMREDFDKQKYAEKNSNIRLTINNYTSLKTEIENLLKKYSSNKKASEVYKKLKTEFTNSKDECMKFITEIIQKCHVHFDLYCVLLRYDSVIVACYVRKWSVNRFDL